MPIFGAVDIGANSVRLKIAELVRSRFVVLHEDREVTRLGESVFRTGALDPEAMANAVRVLRRFHRATQNCGAERVRVVATSALRDAENATAFTQWVFATTGWNIEIITGLEEGRLIHLGVMANTRMGASRMLLIDLGGGSCELTVSSQGQIERIYSLPLGAVRLTRDFLANDPPKRRELEQLRDFIREEIGRVREKLLRKRINLTVATSGTPAALSEAWAAEQGSETNTVPRAGLQRLAKRISKLSLEQRRAITGIGPRRAEIIVAGATVFNELLTELQLPSFRYLPYGLRDGLLAQMVADYDGGTSMRQRIASERENSLIHLSNHYQVDSRYAERIRLHCERLFKSLQPVHCLPPEYGDWLDAAAMLHETGSFINRTGRHRHTWYVIANSELFGYTQQQRKIIAAIARFVGNSRPEEDSPPMRVIPAADRLLVPRAVMLLRLARAMEQGRRGAVHGLRVRSNDEEVRLTMLTRVGGAELELWALEKEKQMFRQTFNRELVCGEA
ncbi:MAG TPA: Ppx/GppA phosphatase family protein [candidate division Zixibacteria bacterium]|nr:Ppx/GppA phosphatase family protein [candidate division Zixibacteria bacterium]